MGLLDTLLDWLGGNKSRSEFDAIEAEVVALSVEEARARMEPLLSDPTKYEVAREPLTSGSLPAGAAALLGEYAYVATKYGDTVLDRDEVRPSEYYPEYIRIGESTDGSEVIVAPTGDTVYRVDGTEEEPAEMESYPSVYHFLLSNARIIYPEAFEGGRSDA